jgi:hypothetical protein
MKHILLAVLWSLCLPALWAQAIPAKLEAADMEFFHFFLAIYDGNKAILFGLNEEEAAAAERASKAYVSALNTSAAARELIRANKARLSPDDDRAVTSQSAQFDATAEQIALKFIAAIRPDRAAYLRHQARLVEGAKPGARNFRANAVKP